MQSDCKMQFLLNLSPAVEQFSKFIIENCDSKEKIETKNIY